MRRTSHVTCWSCRLLAIRPTWSGGSPTTATPGYGLDPDVGGPTVSALSGWQSSSIAHSRCGAEQGPCVLGSAICRLDDGLTALWLALWIRPIPIETALGFGSGQAPFSVGTRIAVYDVLEYLAAGMTAEEIIAGFP